MINLIKLELYKLKRLSLYKIILVFVIVISAFSSFSALNFTAAGSALTGKVQYISNFHDIAILLVNGIFASAYIGLDFNNRTIQAQISRGQLRKNILLSKSICYVAASSVITLIYPVVGAVIVTSQNGWGTTVTTQEILYMLLAAAEGILLNIGTSSFFVLIVFSLRDVTRSICFCLAFPVLFSLIKPLLSEIPVINLIINLFTLSQIRNIGGKDIVYIVLSTAFSSLLCFTLANNIFKKAEIK